MTVYGPLSPKYGREGRLKRRKRSVSSVKKSCDVLWSQLIRSKGACERCGATPDQVQLHAHHVYGRNNHRLRWEPRNGVCLCAACHRWVHNEPFEFTRWMQIYSTGTERAGDYDWLRSENRKGLLKRNLDDYLALEGELKRLLVP